MRSITRIDNNVNPNIDIVRIYTPVAEPTQGNPSDPNLTVAPFSTPLVDREPTGSSSQRSYASKKKTKIKQAVLTTGNEKNSETSEEGVTLVYRKRRKQN